MNRPRLLSAAVLALTAVALGGPAASQASYPGKNGPILFHSKGDVWTIRADGSKLARATNVKNADESSPSVSPNGKRMAVTVTAGGSTAEIWTADLHGKHAVWVTKALSKSGKFLSFRSPAWSKDGKRLVFLCNSFSKHELCSTTADGKGFKYLTNCGCVNVGASDAPDVSSTNRVVWAYGSLLYTVPISGGKPKQIATTNGTNDLNFQYPSWSSNGKQIAVQLNDVESAIDIMDADGGNRHRVLQSSDFSVDPTDYGTPAWSPDSTRLAIQVAGNGPKFGGKPEGIYTVNPDGSGLAPVLIPPVGQEFDQYLELDWARQP